MPVQKKTSIYFTIELSLREISFILEIKLDVTWSYVKRQTAKMTSEFLFFSSKSNASLNHIKIEKCLLLFATNTNVFTLLFKEPKTDGKSFIFAVYHLRGSCLSSWLRGTRYAVSDIYRRGSYLSSWLRGTRYAVSDIQLFQKRLLL